MQINECMYYTLMTDEYWWITLLRILLQDCIEVPISLPFCKGCLFFLKQKTCCQFKPGVQQSMVSQRVRHDWATELSLWGENMRVLNGISPIIRKVQSFLVSLKNTALFFEASIHILISVLYCDTGVLKVD